MATYTSKVYECSRSNATVTNGANSWVNEFSDPIELEPGDQVRVLGSFVNEASTGDSMEITEEFNSFNINFMPYIKGTTFATTDTTDDLLTLGQIASPAYSTDSFGIEPPTAFKIEQHFEGDTLTTDEFSSYLSKISTTGNRFGLTVPKDTNPTTDAGFNLDNQNLYNDPDITGTTKSEVGGDHLGRFQTDNQIANTWGSNLITGNYSDQFNDYSNFSNVSIPNDFLISSLCKKIILPVLKRFRTHDYNNYGSNLDYTFDDLVYNPPTNGSNGTLNGVPKPGYMIATVDIGNSAGWYDETGTAYLEQGHQFGMANLKAGVASVIGKVLAVRPIKHVTTDTMSTTGKTFIDIDCFEVYVYDCINPAQINKMTSYTAPAQTLTKANNPQVILEPALGQTKKLVRQVHGAPEYQLGYSPNPSFNHINGMFNEVKPQSLSMGGIPVANNYSNKTDATNTNKIGGAPLSSQFFTLQGEGEPTYQIGSDLTANELSEYDYGYGKYMGLSYLWSGSHTGTMIYETPSSETEIGGVGTYNLNDSNYRENSRTYIGKLANETCWEFKVENMKYVFDGVSQNDEAVEISMVSDNTSSWNFACGAIICCPPEEMERIVKGHYGSNTFDAVGTTIQTTGSAVGGTNTITLQDITGINATADDFGRTQYIGINGFQGNTQFLKILLVNAGVGLAGTITVDLPITTSFNNLAITINDPRTYLPRLWCPWTYQTNESGYNERHMKNNSYTTKIGLTNALATASGALSTLPTAFIERNEENRFDIGFLGTPTNWNWRQPYLPLKDAFKGVDPTTRINTSGNKIGTEITIETVTSNNPLVSVDYTAFCDRMPRYYSTPTGLKVVSPVPATDPNANLYAGAPYMWGGYNNCNISTHFQQPQTGDVALGLNNISTQGGAYIAILQGAVLPGIYTFPALNPTVDLADFYVFSDSKGNIALPTGLQVNVYTDNGALPGSITIKKRDGTAFTETLDTGTRLYLSPVQSQIGAGTDAVAWSADCLNVKEYNMKIKVSKGFYTNEHIAAEINKILHRSTADYESNDGIYNNTTNKFDVPTTVGIREQSLASENSLVNANFIHSYIPDLSYGFIPVTKNNSAKLNQTASSTEYSGTNNIKTYDTYDVNTNTWTFYPEWDLDNNSVGVDVKTMTGTPCGKHIKFYSVPYLTKTSHAAGQSTQLHLFRLKGGALNQTDFDTTGKTSEWNNKVSRCQNLEVINNGFYTGSFTEPVTGTTVAFTSQPAGIWRTRLARNLLTNGGGARIFAGANNATFQYSSIEDRLQFSNLYTPYRPHQSSNPDKTDFDIGDAIPAAIVNARRSGAIVSSITGLYITNLNADAINTINYGSDYFNNILYDTDSDTNIQTVGTTFLSQLGFSNTQVATFSNSLDLVDDPFTFINSAQFSGTTLTNRAKIDTAINASNPMVSNCTEIAPVRQFYAEVESDTVSAENPTTRGTDPFYLIGSDFPSTQFYGSTEGQHLPVIGICSRNFSAFNFVFDLGGSSITYTIDQKISLKSIKTEIYTSRLGTPGNLNDYSSVIYLVTKNKYVNQITQPQMVQEVAQILEQNATQQMVGAFYNQPQASYRIGIPPDAPKNYYDSEGSYYTDTTVTTDPFEDEFADN